MFCLIPLVINPFLPSPLLQVDKTNPSVALWVVELGSLTAEPTPKDLKPPPRVKSQSVDLWFVPQLSPCSCREWLIKRTKRLLGTLRVVGGRKELALGCKRLIKGKEGRLEERIKGRRVKFTKDIPRNFKRMKVKKEKSRLKVGKEGLIMGGKTGMIKKLKNEVD